MTGGTGGRPAVPSGARTTTGRLPVYRELREPNLVFSAGPNAQRDVHPLRGLTHFGPYSPPPVTGAVRIATISMTGQGQQLFKFLRGLQGRYEPSDRKPYVPPFPGFAQVVHTDLAPAHGQHFDIDPARVGEGQGAHERLIEVLGRALRTLHAHRDEWDVVVFLLPVVWEGLRESLDGAYDLHDRVKALAAPMGIPVQFLREASAMAFKHHASLAWRLTIALLAKAGGTPWRIEPVTPEETAYIGLAYAIRGGTSNGFVTCCSQVFDAEGGGMEFVAYNVGAARDPRNPHLTRDEMRTVMARSVRLYQQRHAGRTPRRLSVHKTSRWRPEEIDGVYDAWSATTDIECVTVQAKTPWRGVALERGKSNALNSPGSWPVSRGTLQQLSGRAALLWVSGPAAVAVHGGTHNPSVKGIPVPSLLHRDAGHGPLETMASDVLALSKLDWNNDAAFGTAPVTIGHSQRLARVIAHVPELPDNVYPYRLFM